MVSCAFLGTLAAAGLAGCERGSPPEAEAQEPAPPARQSAAACALRAEEQTGLLDAQVTDLCRAAPSPSGPVACFLAAEARLDVPDDQMVRLCQCAETDEPVDCWETVEAEGGRVDAEIESMCAPTAAYGAAGCQPSR